MVLNPDDSDDVYELTIIMPCLNEANTIECCIGKAIRFLESNHVSGEVIVADNGSTDGSQELAERAGARVIPVVDRGYGAAIMGGVAASRSTYAIMGDADDSYDFSSLGPMLDELRKGADLVIGNRFKGGIEPSAMPALHRYLGNPVLSFIGRLFYRSSIGDFHCGLRGFRTLSIRRLGLTLSGMEFASEMIVKSTLNNLRISEVPIKLYKDGRGRPPHLRTWRDGWRHLRFLLILSPRWLFLIPGLLLLTAGSAAMATISTHLVVIGGFGLDIHTMAYAGAAILLGFQMILFALMAKLIGIRNGWLPDNKSYMRWISRLTLERCLIASLALFALGLGSSLYAVLIWASTDFGALDPRTTMRWVVPSVTAITLAGELFLAAFFIEALRLPNPRGSNPAH